MHTHINADITYIIGKLCINLRYKLMKVYENKTFEIRLS